MGRLGHAWGTHPGGRHPLLGSAGVALFADGARSVVVVAARAHPVTIPKVCGLAQRALISVGAAILCRRGFLAQLTPVAGGLAGIVVVSTGAHPIAVTEATGQARHAPKAAGATHPPRLCLVACEARGLGAVVVRIAGGTQPVALAEVLWEAHTTTHAAHATEATEVAKAAKLTLVAEQTHQVLVHEIEDGALVHAGNLLHLLHLTKLRELLRIITHASGTRFEDMALEARRLALVVVGLALRARPVALAEVSGATLLLHGGLLKLLLHTAAHATTRARLGDVALEARRLAGIVVGAALRASPVAFAKVGLVAGNGGVYHLVLVTRHV